MPYGLKRFQKAEALHFITFSCFHRLPFLEAAATKETFEIVLEQTRSRHQARVYAYVLMPEHIHLLVTEPEVGTPSTVMQVLKQRTARALLPRRKRRNPRQGNLFGNEPRRCAETHPRRRVRCCNPVRRRMHRIGI